jgi:hypothetical protein
MIMKRKDKRGKESIYSQGLEGESQKNRIGHYSRGIWARKGF